MSQICSWKGRACGKREGRSTKQHLALLKEATAALFLCRIPRAQHSIAYTKRVLCRGLSRTLSSYEKHKPNILGHPASQLFLSRTQNKVHVFRQLLAKATIWKGAWGPDILETRTPSLTQDLANQPALCNTTSRIRLFSKVLSGA